MNQIPPFFVGQEVVAIVGSTVPGFFKKGDEFTILAVKNFCCQWVVDVGLKYETPSGLHCPKCNRQINHFTKVVWAMASRFAPKDQFTAISFTKVIEEELTSVN